MTRIIILLVCLTLAAPALATEFRTGRSASVAPNEVVHDDLFISGNDVEVAGHVEGDVFAAGRTVRITGPVDGSVMAAGEEVLVSGDVTGSVRAAGNTVSISGPVGRNVAAAASEFTLTETGRAGRDLHAAAGKATVDGAVDGRATIAGSTITLAGNIGGDLWLEGQRLSLGPAAQVGGNLTYRSPGGIAVPSSARIHGTTTVLPPREAQRRSGAWSLIFQLGVFVFGILGLAAYPRVFTPAANAMANRWWWNLLLGVVGLFILPFGLLLVCVTVIGIPVGLFGLFILAAGIMAAGIPVGIFIGRALMGWSRPTSPYLALFVGLAALTVVGFIPYLGSLTKFLTVLFGLGVYFRAAKGIAAEMRQRPA